MKDHSNVMLNMALDEATEIVDTSQWTVREDIFLDTCAGGIQSSFSIYSENNLELNGFHTRELAEAYVRDYNTPAAQAERVAIERLI